jgi:hypothetical protein
MLFPFLIFLILLAQAKQVSEQRILSYLYKSEELYNRDEMNSEQTFDSIRKVLQLNAPSSSVTKSILSITSLLVLPNTQHPSRIVVPASITIHTLLNFRKDLSSPMLIQLIQLLASLVSKHYTTCYTPDIALIILQSIDFIMQTLETRGEGKESMAKFLPLALSHISKCQIRSSACQGPRSKLLYKGVRLRLSIKRVKQCKFVGESFYEHSGLLRSTYSNVEYLGPYLQVFGRINVDKLHEINIDGDKARRYGYVHGLNKGCWTMFQELCRIRTFRPRLCVLN